MEAKIEKISELSKLLSVKTRMSDDLFHLFGKFGIGHLLSRLSLEKQDGVSAFSFLLALFRLALAIRAVRTIKRASTKHTSKTKPKIASTSIIPRLLLLQYFQLQPICYGLYLKGQTIRLMYIARIS